MNKPRKHAELIKAWADGATIQFRPDSESEWCDIEDPMWDEDYYYRVKPAIAYPTTSMDDAAILTLWHNGGGVVNACLAIANAAIKQAIMDGDVLINPNKQD